MLVSRYTHVLTILNNASHTSDMEADKWFDAPLHPLSEIAAAAGMSVHLTEAWLQRKLLVPSDHDLYGLGTGKQARFTLRTGLRLAVMAALVRLGLGPSTAAPHARELTDQAWDARELTDQAWDASGETLLLVRSDTAQIVNVPSDGKLSDLLQGDPAMIVIDLKALYRRVVTTLMPWMA
jgi:hypothetical protein